MRTIGIGKAVILSAMVRARNNTMTVHLIINALIIAVVTYLVDRFVSVSSGINKAIVIGVLAALALIFVPQFLP